jgi:membrane associated rhomboid family serine protease
MTSDSQTILRISPNEALAHDWELVLLAQGLSPRMHYTLDSIVLTVPSHQLDRALEALAAYEKENATKTQSPDAPAPSIDLRAGVIAGLALLAFFVVTVLWHTTELWLERGSANAARILDGELWRTVTALALHVDVAHVLSNAFAMAVFFGAVSGQLGAGIGGALLVLAGAGGNFANAYLQGSPHDAVGASTAVFGAVGMLGSLAMMRRRRTIENRRRAWIIIAASLALLGMLGSGGARVDVLAHLLGFLVGGALGFPVAFLLLPRPPGVVVQWISGAVTIATIVYCWMLALHGPAPLTGPYFCDRAISRWIFATLC